MNNAAVIGGSLFITLAIGGYAAYKKYKTSNALGNLAIVKILKSGKTWVLTRPDNTKYSCKFDNVELDTDNSDGAIVLNTLLISTSERVVGDLLPQTYASIYSGLIARGNENAVYDFTNNSDKTKYTLIYDPKIKSISFVSLTGEVIKLTTQPLI